MSWPEVSFGEIAEFRNGLNYSRESFGSGLKIISVADFGSRFCPDFASLDEINPEGVAKAGDHLCEGDLIFVRSNGNRDLVGRVMLIKGIGDLAVSFSGFCIRARLTHPDVLPAFYTYLFRSPSIRNSLTAGGVGANIANVSQKTLSRLLVPFPGKSEQGTIVAALSAYDDLIATNQRRIALLEEAARRIYREWFVSLRFPGHETVPVKDGVPEGWQRDTLDQAIFLQRGFDLPNGNRIPGDIPVYASTGINGLHNEARAVGPGVVTGRSGTLGQVHYVAKDYWPLNTSLWVKEFRRVSPLFAYFLLSNMNLEQFNSGASVPTLDRKTAHQASVLIPAPQVIEQFDVLVQPFFDQIEILKSGIESIVQARDLLLPKLMSGELDVSGIQLPDEVVV